MNELHEVRADWYDLGVQLRMETSDLDAIELENMKDSKKCLRKMLSLWLTKKTPSPPSWQRVVDALRSRSINRPTLAEIISNNYCHCQDVGRLKHSGIYCLCLVLCYSS